MLFLYLPIWLWLKLSVSSYQKSNEFVSPKLIIWPWKILNSFLHFYNLKAFIEVQQGCKQLNPSHASYTANVLTYLLPFFLCPYFLNFFYKYLLMKMGKAFFCCRLWTKTTVSSFKTSFNNYSALHSRRVVLS